MDSEYILGPDGELYHWGIRGMKWGVRRYQNRDGSLTPAGQKRYDDKLAKIENKTAKIRAKQEAKQAIEDRKNKLNAAKQELANAKKGNLTNEDDISSATAASAQKRERLSDMSDSDLQQRVNRLRNEDAYKDLSKKLGYNQPMSELDAKISEMEKRKKYLELERDIANLTPKKVSNGKKFVDSVLHKVVEPAVSESSKAVLKKFLTDSGMNSVADFFAKEAVKTAKQQAAKEARAEKQQAAKEARAEKKAAKQEAKKAAKERETTGRDTFYDDHVFEAEYVGNRDRKSSSRSTNNNKSTRTTYDAVWWENVYDAPVTTITNSSRGNSSGKNYVSDHWNTPVNSLPSPNIQGYLPAPKDDDD